MPGGMRLDNNTIRTLPLHMQEQVAMAFAAQPAKAVPVADREESPPKRKVRVRRLRFINARAAWRYLQLREETRCENIFDLVLTKNGEHVIHRFTYCVTEEY